MAPRPISYRELLNVADLPALLAAATLSRLAGSMFTLTIALYAVERFSSPALAGWLIFALLGPGVVVSPLAGTFLDRMGPVSAITVDMAASSALVLMLVAADRSGYANATVLFALVATFSLTSPLGRAGVRTLLPRLVPSSALDRANALDTAIYAATDVLGPGLAGLLVGFFGPSPSLIAIAFIFAGAALSIYLVRATPKMVPVTTSLLRQTLEGVRAVVREPTLRGLAVSYSLYQVAWGVLVIVVPVFAVRHFAPGTGSSIAGFMWAAAGVAGGVGALVAGHLRTTGRERRVMATGMLITALAAWPVASEFGFYGLVVGLLMVGAVGGPIDVGLLTLRQRRTEPSQLGRVLSVSMSLNIVGYPVGSALAGMLITHSLSATFLLASVAAALAAITVLAIPRDTARSRRTG